MIFQIYDGRTLWQILGWVMVFAVILKRAKDQKKNPYTNEIFTDQKDFSQAMVRAE